jgi:hypothetical protein
MSEQVKELFLKSLDDNQEFCYQRFAKLIVEECAGIIESQDVDPSFKLRMSWAVKQYFGVENGTI